MPYRVDVPDAGSAVVERLIELGALDADLLPGGGVAAVMPDAVTIAEVEQAVVPHACSVCPADARDDGSVWVLAPRAIQSGRLRIVPAHAGADAGAVRLVDSPAFGTGLHPTTALCLEALQDVVQAARPGSVLDVGTGSGVLALAALVLGVPRAVGIDIEQEALRAAAENARNNGLGERLRLVRGGPESIDGSWPLVLANVLAAPLIEMAPAIARRLDHGGMVVLSGIPGSVEEDVARAYVRQGLRRAWQAERGGWVALVMQASW